MSVGSSPRKIESSKIRDMVVERGAVVRVVEGMEVVAR
jgi:hypothetical protein